MANWNGFPLFSNPDGTTMQSGGLLVLTGPSTKAASVEVNGASVEVHKDSRDLVVRLPVAMTPANLLKEIVRIASAGLDLLAAEGGPFALIGLHPETDLMWWKDYTGEVARVAIHHSMAFRFRASAIVVDASGNEAVGPGPVQPRLHESFRYFRLSQCTDDLFDAFRNAYLAMEAVLADVAPKNAGETEGAWVRRAMATAQSQVDLSGALGCQQDDVPARFHDDVYKGVRCPLFHGKKMGLDSASAADRKRVLWAYEAVVQCFILLASACYGFRAGGSGGLTSQGFASLSSLMDGWLIRAGQGLDEDTYEMLAEMRRVASPSPPGRILAMSRAEAPLDAPLATVNFIAAFHEDALAFWCALEGCLNTMGLDALEVSVDLSNNFDRGYRTDFPG